MRSFQEKRSIIKKSPATRWIGGKSRLSSFILPKFPKHTCYVEVFAGSACLFFKKEPVKVEIINDINSDIINVYRVIQNHAAEFIRHYNSIVCSREEFDKYKKCQVEYLTDVQRAVRFYYLLKLSFAGDSFFNNPIFCASTVSPPTLNLKTLRREILSAKERLARVYIENLSYEKIFEKYDGEDVFIILTHHTWAMRSCMGRISLKRLIITICLKSCLI